MTRALGLLARRAFDPATITKSLWLPGNGTYWQDSARTTPATADGDPVGAWDDTSGNARHCTQATSGKRPILKTGANGLNGLPVLRFDGSDDQLGSTIDTGTVQRIFIVAKKRSAPAAGADKAIFGMGGSGVATMETNSSIAANYVYVANGSTVSVGVGGAPTSWQIIFIVVASASSMVFRFNGGSAAATIDPRDEVTTSTSFNLCTGGAPGGNYGDYDVAEVFRTSAGLTNIQSDNIGNYLADKYDLAWALIA